MFIYNIYKTYAYFFLMTKSQNNYNRREMASSERSKNRNKEKREIEQQTALTYIKYRDHVLFRNCDPSKIKPVIREVVGWVTFESSEALIICSDVPAEPLPHRKPVESGFLILKNAIIERHGLESGKAFKRSRIAYCGQKKPYKTEN
jgi:hypothetical protein